MINLIKHYKNNKFCSVKAKKVNNYSNEIIDTVFDMYDDGETVKKIADHLFINESTIYNWLRNR